MEPLDTDEKLVENSKDKNKKNFSNSHYLFIGICVIIILIAIYLLIKVFKSQNSVEGK